MIEKLKTIIIDDEKNATEVIRLQLTNYCQNISIVAICNSGKEAIVAIKKHQPDLVFLDIEMPHINGFDVLNATKECLYKVIFTTAYDRFAVKAFKYSAIDYLLKPIDIQELQQAVAKISVQPKQNMQAQFAELFAQMQSTNNAPKKVALTIGDTLQFFNASEIIRCESDSNYTYIFLSNNTKVTTAKTLKDVEENFKGLDFCRVHQSHLINMACIAKYIKGDNAYLVMLDESIIPVSRNKKEEFLERFTKV